MMSHARLPQVARAFALALCAALLPAQSAGAKPRDGGTEAGAVISNRAEVSYTDAGGNNFTSVSALVAVTVRAVAALSVTPDETEPSATVGPGETVERLFRVCNTGNTSDRYTITAAEADAPAAVLSLHFDADGTGTVTGGDTEIALGQTLSAQVGRGACVGVVAVVATNAATQGQRISIRLTARSNADGVGGADDAAPAQDVGAIVNEVGRGAVLSSPEDPALPPVKLVEGRERVTASPGQTLEYEIAFRNSGDVAARGVVLGDELPAGLDYSAGTLRVNNQSVTDAEDADAGHVRGRLVEVRLAQLAAGEVVRVAFRARVGASVPAGRGVVNTASVGAENAAASASTSATAVTDPFGLIYQGRTAGAPVPGARVSLLTDATTGATLPLASGAGSAPNNDNANPFAADAQGRWSFALAPAQLGAIAAPARYFLNVTAPGYLSRLIEVTITPAADNSGLFALAVRALDGQPVARAASFELTETAVEITDLAALALNVPLFETTALGITKAADRPSAEVGETVTYRVEVRNETPLAAADVTVRDVLPPSFVYAAGSGRVDAPPAGPRPVEPETLSDGALVFRLGGLGAGARAVVTYRARVGANAREGEQFNTAQAEAVLAGGERLSTATARASVRVRRGAFSSQQLIVGRVFDDANNNGRFDGGERGLPGVRLYLNNGESVITDSEGLYNFPVVNEGSQVLSLDPVTLPDGYRMAEARRREERSRTRLLRTPLGGGALLRQNFALRSDDGDIGVALRPAPDDSAPARAGHAYAETQDAPARQAPAGARAFGESAAKARDDERKERDDGPKGDRDGTNARGAAEGAARVGVATEADAAAGGATADNGTADAAAKKSSGRPAAKTPGTYELLTNETLAPIAAGEVRLVSPRPGEVAAGAALEVTAEVNAAYTVAVEVGGQRAPDSKIGERRLDRRNQIATFTFVGLNVAPGPNRVRVTAVGPDGAPAKSVEVTAYGRGPARRVEVSADKREVSAGGRDSTTIRVRAFDQWNHPAADGSVAIQASAGRLVRLEETKAAGDAPDKQRPSAAAPNDAAADANAADANDAAKPSAGEAPDAASTQQVVSLVGGEGRVLFVAGSAPGAAVIEATTGAAEGRREVRVTPEVRPSILVGLAELTVGAQQPELSDADERRARSRLAFFYRGRVLGKNLLTLAYDSNRALNRVGRGDRLFQYDPLERAYPLFGDSSTRADDAESNSKLYLRLDRGRSYFLFGDFETDNADAGLASYTRKLTGAKLHLENSAGDFVSVTGARPDTAFARDVFPGGSFAFARLSRAEVLPGSETVTIEVRDRRNPETVLSREQLARSVDYNLDAVNGEIFFLRPVSAFDFAFNLVQVVVTYEHRAAGGSSDVYTARAFKNFEGLGLKLGLSFVSQRQGEFGSFLLGGADAEKSLPRGGKARVEWAASHGRVVFGGNLSGSDADERHDGQALRAEVEQPLPYKETTLRARFARAGADFLNPFGQTVTPGSRRLDVSVETRVRPSSRLTFGFADERNRTENVNNGRRTLSFLWSESFSDSLRATFGYDFRHFSDELTGRATDSNLLSAGAEWQATDRLRLSVKREQNLSEADPTYPNQTTLAADYRWNQFTRLFFTQRLASAPITPISDAAATGFFSSGARRETAVGVETKLGKIGNLSSRYQLENGVNGSDSFAVIGLSNRFAVSKTFSLDLGYERGLHLAGEGQSFNSGHLGFSWLPVEDFRASGRYELRDRGGLGTVLTLGAAGRLLDNLTSLARFQLARSGFGGRDSSSLNVNAAIAWRPLESDRAGLLFNYTRRDLRQEGGASRPGAGAGEAPQPASETRDRSDTLSADWYYQATREVELYGRFAVRHGETAGADLARVSTFTYLTQGRAAYRFARDFDAAAEARWLAQPASATRRLSVGAELGYWALPDLRFGGGYNWAGAAEPGRGGLSAGRRGFYVSVSSKLSNLFDLFGAREEKEWPAGNGAQTASAEKRDE
jgi:trimeric autotransporter adhesin